MFFWVLSSDESLTMNSSYMWHKNSRKIIWVRSKKAYCGQERNNWNSRSPGTPVKTTCGFIQKQHMRASQNLQSNTHTSPFTTTESPEMPVPNWCIGTVLKTHVNWLCSLLLPSSQPLAYGLVVFDLLNSVLFLALSRSQSSHLAVSHKPAGNKKVQTLSCTQFTEASMQQQQKPWHEMIKLGTYKWSPINPNDIQ